ncbi:hypothetical protein OBBRIDRAFT_432729 [Obba rivulosa]|uniref:Uncharacterized protein n=1 Tax=Obba rivulosa TaxID=1052685 RepID=A0A8E2DFS9_9APHY|nr:hypothetical protein OBBRIDRAFT_432729 [Obba rivulosa]
MFHLRLFVVDYNLCSRRTYQHLSISSSSCQWRRLTPGLHDSSDVRSINSHGEITVGCSGLRLMTREPLVVENVYLSHRSAC